MPLNKETKSEIVYKSILSKTKKIAILILFNITDRIKSKNKNYISYC